MEQLRPEMLKGVCGGGGGCKHLDETTFVTSSESEYLLVKRPMTFIHQDMQERRQGGSKGTVEPPCHARNILFSWVNSLREGKQISPFLELLDPALTCDMGN